MCTCSLPQFSCSKLLSSEMVAHFLAVIAEIHSDVSGEMPVSCGWIRLTALKTDGAEEAHCGGKRLDSVEFDLDTPFALPWWRT